MTDSIKHKFELAGLGRAPFQFVELVIKRYKACPEAPSQPGGSCAYCGTGIVECCVIRDADGKRFEVGNECVLKTDDAGLVNLTKRAVNRVRAEARHKREAERIEAARAILAKPEIQSKLQAQPHPYSDLAAKGLTELDWATWMMAHAGNRGRIEVAKTLEGMVA